MTTLARVERQLGLFVEAMAGRYLHIKARSERRPELAALGLAQQSQDTLYFPDELPEQPPVAYRVLAMLQIGLREFGTFTFRLQDLIRQSGQFGDTEPPPASGRTGDFEQFFAHYRNRPLIRALFAELERVRVEARLRAHYPGLEGPFRAWHQAELLNFDPGLAAADAWLSWLERLHHRFGAGLPPEDDALHARIEPLWARLARPDADVYTTCRTADSLYGILLPSGIPDWPDTDGRPEAFEWLQREQRLQDWDALIDELDGQLWPGEAEPAEPVNALDAGDQPGNLRPEGLEFKEIQDARDQLARRRAMEESALRHALGRTHANARSFRYPEWDMHAGRYLPDWCRLYETVLDPDGAASPESLRTAIRPYLRPVVTQLRQIRPRGLVRIRPEPDGDELDPTSVIEARLDQRAGITPGDRLYSRQERLQRDLAVVFLVDLSASTDDPIEPISPAPAADPAEQVNLRDPLDFEPPDPEPAGPPPRRIIDVQREAMLVMAIALQQLGDEFGIYGFSGYGRDEVEFYVAKELSEDLTPRSLQRIAAMNPKRSTRMGPAVRHATGKLLASGRATQLLIIVSDGFPQDCDYGPDRGSHEYGVHDTARALREAEDRGITTFNVTVDRAGHDYLREMCPAARYAVIDDMEMLPQELGKLYRSLTA